MAKIWITIDVEAQIFRAEESHVERLIWGRFPDGEYGIGRMMDVADSHCVPLTMFTDFAETDCHGQTMKDVATAIHRRGHDLQLHVHMEYFNRSVWAEGDIPSSANLNDVTAAQAKCISRELVARYREITGRNPLSFRGGGYCFNENLLKSLGQVGVRIDSSVNRSRRTQPFQMPPSKQFLWPNDILEIPVATIDGFRNIPRPFDFNFNSAHFPTANDMVAFVEHFEQQFGTDAVLVLVMHSWSFLDISGKFFGPPRLEHVERFGEFIKRVQPRHEFVESFRLLKLFEAGKLLLDPTVDPRELGMTFWLSETPGLAEPDARRMSFPSSDLREKLIRGPLLSLEEFGYPWHKSPDFRPAMEAMLAGSWGKAGNFVTNMRPPINFDNQPRSHACDLHSWEPAGYALRAFEVFGDKRYLDLASGFIFDWLNRYWLSVSHSKDEKHLDSMIADQTTFAWYDMAVGRRIFRLAYLLDVLARDEAIEGERILTLWDALQFHHAVLGRELFFRQNSNHGFFQALGQYAAAKRFFQMPESASQFALARERLFQLLEQHFSPECVHLEHSPGYHYGLMTSLIGARSSGLLTDRQIKERIDGMETVLSWMIKPDGVIVPIGDSDPKRMERSDAFVGQFEDPGLRFQMSNGRLGAPPMVGVQGYPISGYAFARLHAPEANPVYANASYLAQQAGFHSRVHKHADHLSFVWFDYGRDILIDPGRYGYSGRTDRGSELFEQGFWYSDPKRIYCESTRAHNTVEIDRKSFPRNKVKPFGSVLVYAGEDDGRAVTYCEATHFRTVRHNRQLVMAPGHFLLVLDWLFDRTGVEHEYRQYFHFAQEWDIQQQDGIIAGNHPGRDAIAPLDIRVASLIPDVTLSDVVRGQEEPELLGWLSDAANSLIPTSCFHVYKCSNEPTSFATLFVFGRTLEIDWGATRFNRTLSSGKISWRDDRGKHVLAVAKPVRLVPTDPL